MNKPFMHPSTPLRLQRAYHKAKGKDGRGWNMRALADKLGVNIKYISELIRKGIEPNNPKVRVKLFLRRSARKSSKRGSAPVPLQSPSMRWWRMQKSAYRQSVILELWMGKD
jgi:hypothetical protein